MRKNNWITYLIGIIIIVGVILLIKSFFSKQNDSWTLFIYGDNMQIENTFSGYETLSNCWDGAVVGSQRGEKYFECGRNCGDFASTTASCTYLCPQGKLFECEDEIK